MRRWHKVVGGMVLYIGLTFYPSMELTRLIAEQLSWPVNTVSWGFDFWGMDHHLLQRLEIAAIWLMYSVALVIVGIGLERLTRKTCVSVS